MVSFLKKYSVVICRIVFICSLIAVALWGYFFISEKNAIDKATIAFGEQITNESTKKIDSILINIRQAANELADSLSRYPWDLHVCFVIGTVLEPSTYIF